MKIKDNLNLNGYILQNFCIDNYDSLDGINDKGAGRAVFLTGNSTNAGYGHVNVFDGSKFKALAYTDDVANNEEFLALKERVYAFLDGGVNQDDVLDNLKEIQRFLDNYKGATDLSEILDTKLDKSGGKISGVLTISTSVDKSLVLDEPSGEKYHIISFAANGQEYATLTASALGTNNVLAFNNNTILHRGNYSDYALPLSGGTIDGNIVLNGNITITRDSGALYINTTSDTIPSAIYFFKNLVNYGGIGMSEKNTPCFLDHNNTLYSLLHEGNANKTDIPWSASNILFPKGTSATWNIHTTDAYKGITILNAVGEKPEGAPDHYAVGLSISGYYGFTLASYGGGDGLLYRRKNDSDWKTIAFTDSTVAAANQIITEKGLTYAYANDNGSFFLGRAAYATYLNGNGVYLRYGSKSVNGLILNSSGNVTIGSSDLAGSDAKLYVDGNVALKNNAVIFGKDTSGNLCQVLAFDNGNDFVLGYGMSENGYNTYIDGNHIYFRYGKAHTKAMTITNSGNVLIGTTDDNGAKLQVQGECTASRFTGSSFRTSGGYGVYNGSNWTSALTIADIAYYANLHCFYGNVLIGTPTPLDDSKLQVKGDLHVTGNIIADGEVSAGGAGTEGSGSASGGGAFYAETLATNITTKTIAHGLGTEDIIVSIYEKNVAGKWEMVLTDVEIKDANSIELTFGSATSVEHRVVIMGAVA